MERSLIENSVKLMLTLLKGKKIPEIINYLKDGPLRFSELKKLLDPISKKVLTEQLRKLIDVGLIERTVHTDPTIRVEYSITPLLIEAKPLFYEIQIWEEYYRQNYKHVLESEDLSISHHPFNLIIKILGDKWKPDILFSLYEGKKRFNELKKELSPISQRVLTQNLRELEHYGFISRTVYDDKILHVEYSLTDLCYTLNLVGIEMNKYYVIYNQDIKKAR